MTEQSRAARGQSVRKRVIGLAWRAFIFAVGCFGGFNSEAAVDLVLDKLEQQLRKYKEKIQDHRRTPSMGDVTSAPTPGQAGQQ